MQFFHLLLMFILEEFDKNVKKPLESFYADSVRFLRRCTKPDAKEFQKIANATLIGVLMMGGIGYFVKLLYIPINHILIANG